MTNEWDQYADGWDDDPGARAYAAAAFESLVTVVEDAGPPLQGSAVLDFGCGTGLLTERLVGAGARVTAVDTSTSMLEVLNAKISRTGWTAVQTATSVPDRPPTFDLIVCSSVCAFLEDYGATAAGLAGRLQPGGLFVQWDWERVGDEDHGLTRQEIQQTLSGAGLHQVTVATAFSVDFGGQAMAPLIGYGRRGS